ncbi:MAG: hypothetical protein ACRC6N_05860 [Plesiomonas sp.]|uniref:hypothetical protein n=1 Tax=Plesiomonas sp. TaxID=2486279 RepID=UPI003F2EFFDF
MKKNKVLIVCVDYFSEVETRSYIKKVKDIAEYVDIVVVCNSGLIDFSRNYNHGVYAYDFNHNLGYMEAAHQGLKMYLKENSMPDWIILSNTDIDFPNADIFDRLRLDLRLDSVIAPDIVTLDGIHQNPFLKKRPSFAKIKFLTIIYSSSILNKIYSLLSLLRKKKFFGTMDGLGSDIYAPHGSFIMFGRDYFTVSPTLEHPTFLYGEELHIAERARLKSMRIIYDKDYSIMHREHVTTSKIPGFSKAKIMRDSLLAILKEYY